MKKVVSIQEARPHLSKLIKEVEAGADVTIARAGKPVIRLVKYEDETTTRKLGFAIGEFSDLSNSEWEELDDKFRALFDCQQGSSEAK
jgi:prevent-host-death family protein